MREKYYIIVSIVLSTLVFSGCSSEEKYSEEETNIIADYVAQTVIKHSEGYEGKLVDTSDNPFLLTKEEDFVDSLRGGATHDDLDSDKDVVNKEEPATKSEDYNESTDETSSIDDKKEEQVLESNISEILKFQDGIEVCVGKYEVLKEYASSSYVIDIADDEKLIMVEFDIKNNTSKDIEVKVDSVRSKFKLVTEEDEYSPMMTALENDFMYFNKNIKANSSKKAVLLFTIPKNLTMDNISLEIQGSDTKMLKSLDK